MAEIFEEVKRRDPKPPRQISPDVRVELERICLKCLEKRQTDRYASAAELLEDLQAWLQESSTEARAPYSPCPGNRKILTRLRDPLVPLPYSDSHQSDQTTPPPRIVPKGLRSFDEHDADFFLELLPGARDRDGLPESIRFWKQPHRGNGSEKTFRVGLIYGPSGCGKSSLVKAGLLPRWHRTS